MSKTIGIPLYAAIGDGFSLTTDDVDQATDCLELHQEGGVYELLARYISETDSVISVRSDEMAVAYDCKILRRALVECERILSDMGHGDLVCAINARAVLGRVH